MTETPVPRHVFRETCRAGLFGDIADHKAYVVEHSGRVFCERCGAEAVVAQYTPPPRPTAPLSQQTFPGLD